ncbi:protein-disulfide reductase DsbD domain-containing protein [Leeuwenhoekiella polynyae]|uniref:Thiol:disulfide interchange protein DsbD n=1 Tax=Leeuwenhoekiella polynyae TaxID=1550906 RepID=A0A4Q0PGX0_9FLAO|nr:protein-disulfide reductase DsbD domain-containing protein [Leeuwenhoekiella polynyae]RXG26242.1 thiol:disulfide interchange protein DsbD [Leeuwenhoekiella polynyae]
MQANTLRTFFLKLFLASCLFFTGSTAFSQIYDPVSWETSVKELGENKYELQILATIEPGWHLYAQNLPEGGPVPTSFSFPFESSYKIIGKVEQSKPHTFFDDIFEMETSYYENRATFSQIVQVKETSLKTINAEVTFMVCDDSQCLPPTTEELHFKIPISSKPETSEPKEQNVKSKTSVDEQDSVEEKSNLEEKTNDQKEIGLEIDEKRSENKEKLSESKKDSSNKEIKSSQENEDNNNASDTDNKSLWGIFIVSFLSGFAALLTPCVFPMIPLTVSFFTKQSKNRAVGIRNAIIYGLSIIVIYVLLGSLVTLIFGADALNALSTNIWFNLVFFVILVIFAVSFLGAFEIVLPSSWGTKMDARADKGGMIGIFFMALALAIVSFSCTGPIVGTLLVQAASKGGLAPIVGMLGFSGAIAIPFALFAAFPGWLNSLPKSGGWLNTVKAVLGFLELALAFKFLSNADLVLQLHLLERETFLAIWIAILGTLTLYLFGKIKLPHDSPLPSISVGRLSLGMLTLAFTVYLIPGLWGAPLQWISGFPPPQQYSESPYGVGNTKGGMASQVILPEGAELGPHDIPAFKDYETGMAYAEKVNKPVLLDFTGYACVNCRKMEERVWSDPQVLQLLQNDVVLISLYVDDKKELPETEQYVSKTTGKKIKTIGNKWSDFQITHYKANAQPYYVLIDIEGKNLNDPTAYNPDIDSYLDWLREGIENYN